MIKINDIGRHANARLRDRRAERMESVHGCAAFLTKVGDSGDTGGQHSITVQYDSLLEDGQYYIPHVR